MVLSQNQTKFDIREQRMRSLLGFVTALILLVIAAVVVAYSGAYNVAARAPDPGILQWFLATTMEHSVRNHAQGITPRTDLRTTRRVTDCAYMERLASSATAGRGRTLATSAWASIQRPHICRIQLLV